MTTAKTANHDLNIISNHGDHRPIVVGGDASDTDHDLQDQSQWQIWQSCHNKSILGRAATASLSFVFHQGSLFSSHVGSQLCIHSFYSISMCSDVYLCASKHKFTIILSGYVRMHFRNDSCDLWQLRSWLYQLLITHAILLEWCCAMFVFLPLF